MKKINKLVVLLAISLVSTGVHADEQQPTIQLRTLAPDIAHKIVLAAVNECTERGYKVSAASLQASTSEMSSRTDLSFAPGILLIVGGVPINFGGNFYGGVAVAGAEVEDEKNVHRRD